MAFDHLVISAATLKEGVQYVEDSLGVAMAGGGEHPAMGTHNRLLSLGPDDYLEVIAINPDADAPKRPRLFDLDNFAGEPRITNWVMRSNSISDALAKAPPNAGETVPLSRGDFRWQMAIPADGKLPFDGAFPSFIEWQGARPAPLLPATGCRLDTFEVVHPDALGLTAALRPFLDDGRLSVAEGPQKAFRAEISTPNGLCVLV